jgi:hypothetical protein
MISLLLFFMLNVAAIPIIIILYIVLSVIKNKINPVHLPPFGEGGENNK